MKKTTITALLLALALFGGCSDDDEGSTSNNGNSENNGEKPGNDTVIVGGNTLNITRMLTESYSGNIEAVAALDGRSLPSTAASASKAKRIHFLEGNDKKLNNYASFSPEKALSEDDEFTNIAAYDAAHVLITRTNLVKNGKKVEDCRGYLHFVSLADTTATETSVLEVGSMPDSVAISADKKYALTADEHDSSDTWGKCPVASIHPSVTIVSLPEDMSKGAPKVIRTITFTKNAEGQPREPEYVAFSPKSNLAAVTLQDSHEVALIDVDKIAASDKEHLTEDDVTIVSLPKNDAGNPPWPDGIKAFETNWKVYFAIAGEANDNIIIIDDKGKVVSNTAITEKEVPSSYPCLNEADFATIKYSPDSVTTFALNKHAYAAVTLRYPGAVIVYDVTNPEKPVFELITRAGKDDVVNTSGTCGTYDDASKVYPEGITSTVIGDKAYIWTANEGDDTVTMFEVQAK